MRTSRALRRVAAVLGAALLLVLAVLVARPWRHAPTSPASAPPADADAREAASPVDADVTAADAGADSAADARPDADPDAGAIALDELDHEPPKGTCRAAIPPGTPLARVSDRALAAAVLLGVDLDAGTFARAPLGADAGGEWSVRDCVGDRLDFGPPPGQPDDPDAPPDATHAAPRIYAEPAAPMPPPEGEGAGLATGPFRITRGPVLGRKMAVNVTVGITYGYDDTCFGFLALVRLAGGEIVVEAARRATGCAAGELAHLDGKLVVVERSPPSNSGEEEAEVDGSYAIFQPRGGRLVSLGNVAAFHGWGNGALQRTGRFVSFDSKLLAPEGPTLQFQEQWRSELLQEEDHDARAWRRKLVRSYTASGGALVATPRGPPSFATPQK